MECGAVDAGEFGGVLDSFAFEKHGEGFVLRARRDAR